MKNKRGAILILVLIFLIVSISIGVSLTSLVIRGLKSTQQTFDQHLAYEAAEAGIERAMWNINNGDDDDVTLQKVDDAINSEYEVTVDDSVANTRILTAIGYSPSKTATNKKTKSIKVTAVTGGVGIAFRYAVQVGANGISMANNAVINGNAVTDGDITGSNGSKIIGSAWAHGTIPPNPSPPVVTPVPPNVKLSNQSSIALPDVNVSHWKEEAESAGAPCPYSGLTISTPRSLGPCKINGNLIVNAELTLTGPLWVTGNLSTATDGVHFKLDPGFGSAGTVIVVDGTITLGNNVVVEATSSSPKGYILFYTESSSSSAILLDNNVTGGVYYTANGIMTVNNNVHPVSVVCKGLSLLNNARIDYDQGLASAEFQSGPSGGWVVKSWQLL